MHLRPSRLTSLPELTNALVAVGVQNPKATFQHLAEGLPGRVKIISKGGQNLE